MIFSAEAARHVAELEAHFERLDRPEAVLKLRASLLVAIDRLERGTVKGLSAPRPYLELAHPDEAWIKVGRYWICYREGAALEIRAVFFETANIPARR